ncbi:glutamate decarboxylase 3 [Artemisia annua]|uniref:glutamate decarboxylase n=1 Tax=Artemisia annua TaxID=35608 RepID=A0A2U1LQD4_ARTAN|nr:glutamate decarboxylase 3 [Artemisia annua]
MRTGISVKIYGNLPFSMLLSTGMVQGPLLSVCSMMLVENIAQNGDSDIYTNHEISISLNHVLEYNASPNNDRPSIEPSQPKFARYFEVDFKKVKLKEGYYVMDPIKAVEMVDENTICAAEILGSIMTGEFEDAKLLNDFLMETLVQSPQSLRLFYYIVPTTCCRHQLVDIAPSLFTIPTTKPDDNVGPTCFFGQRFWC